MANRRDLGAQEHSVLDDARIDAIIEQVMSELRQAERGPHEPIPVVAPTPPASPAPDLHHAENLFPAVDGAVKAARRAFEQLGELPLAPGGRMIRHNTRAARAEV